MTLEEELKKELPLYDNLTQAEWENVLIPHRHWVRRHLLCAFALFGTPSTYLDIGTGLGDTVLISRLLQIDAWGVDQLAHPSEYVAQADLRLPFSLAAFGGPSVCDLVTCWEVAEHLPPDRAEILVDTISAHVKERSLLVFTSALPGQGGEEHIGCRPPLEWRNMFYDRGLKYQPDKTVNLALLWNSIGSPLVWLPANLQVFER